MIYKYLELHERTLYYAYFDNDNDRMQYEQYGHIGDHRPIVLLQ